MPALQDPRHEAFARARARGALLIDAYESAGFARHRGHPSRLAWKPEVADRIAELRALQTEMEDVTLLGLLASLARIIKAGEASDNPTLVNAARLAIVDAARLQAELARGQSDDRYRIIKDFNAFSKSAAADAASEAAKARPSPPIEAPAAAPSAPIQRPASAPRAPLSLLASAAASPLSLPDGLILRPPPAPPPSPRRRPGR